VELLLKKLREAGLYDSSLIVITGDHSSHYTPEIITFFKRPGEHHERLEIRSVPGKIAALNATILKESGLSAQAKSLFDLPCAVGSLETVRPSSEGEMLVLGAWQKSPLEPDRTGADLFERSFGFQDGQIYLDLQTDRMENTELLFLVADPVKQGTIFRTGSPVTKLPSQLTAPQKGLPDNCYRLYLGCRQKEQSGEQLWVLPQYLLIRQGKTEFVQQLPDSRPQTMHVGQTLRMQQMTPCPELECSKFSRIEHDALLLPERRPLGIRLPASEIPLELQLTLKLVQGFHGKCIFHLEGIPDCSFPLNKLEKKTLTIPLPPMPEEKLHTFRIELRPDHRAHTVMPDIRIYSIALQQAK